MHWLSEQVERVAGLAAGPSDPFLRAVEALVRETGGRPGVLACFAAYEGLLVATAGEGADFDALAATAQLTAEATEIPSLVGRLRQLVIVGEKRKLALIRLGPIVVGILTPPDTHIAAVTSGPPEA